MSRSTTRSAACSSRCQSRAPRISRPAAHRSSARPASLASPTSAQTTCSADATTACRPYNALRTSYGLPPAKSFTDITGEATERFPLSAGINPTGPTNDPDILDFVQLEDDEGNALPSGSDESGEDAVEGIRRTTLAARLKAIYGSVDKVDAFVGMVSEPHVAGSELGPLQLAIWKRQFEALRDGDRFFYENDPFLARIQQIFGITYKHTLAELINLNTGATVEPNVFIAAAEEAAPAP
jgi:peroxidase